MSERMQNRGFEASIQELRSRSNPATEPVQPRYVDWFDGQRISAPAVIRPPEEPKVIDINEATRELTRALMEKAGIQTYDAISSRMPEGSRLRKAIEAKALDHNPLHGVCRVGRVIVGRHFDEFSAAEFYVTNFDAHLSTTTRSFYTPTDRKGGMFFGVGVVIDQAGRRKRFDHDKGVDGKYFQTKDLGKAIYAIASISTGMSIDQLMEIDRTDHNSVKRSRAG
jgi:hypothetical protein